MIALVDRLSNLLDGPGEEKETKAKMYLHCWGGHGRSGTVAVLLLVKRLGKVCDRIIIITFWQDQNNIHNHNKVLTIFSLILSY